MTPAAAPAPRLAPRQSRAELRLEAELVCARTALQAVAGDRSAEILRLLGELADAAVNSDEVSEDELDQLERDFVHAVVEAARRPILARRRGTRRAQPPITAAAPVDALGATP